MMSSSLSWLFLPCNYLCNTRQQTKRTHAALFVLSSDLEECLEPSMSKKIKGGLLSQRCGQTPSGWAPLLGSGKSYSRPCCHCPSLDASVLGRTQCRCSGWSFGWNLNAPRLCSKAGHRERGVKQHLKWQTSRVLVVVTTNRMAWAMVMLVNVV